MARYCTYGSYRRFDSLEDVEHVKDNKRRPAAGDAPLPPLGCLLLLVPCQPGMCASWFCCAFSQLFSDSCLSQAVCRSTGSRPRS